MFEKYGEVENCSIMKDPHTQESRGFGFVKMVTSDQADAAKEGLQGENIGGRTLSIEKARRARPRTPTPGRYFGPPKRGTSILLNYLYSLLNPTQMIATHALKIAEVVIEAIVMITAMTIVVHTVVVVMITILGELIAMLLAGTIAMAEMTAVVMIDVEIAAANELENVAAIVVIVAMPTTETLLLAGTILPLAATIDMGAAGSTLTNVLSCVTA